MPALKHKRGVSKKVNIQIGRSHTGTSQLLSIHQRHAYNTSQREEQRKLMSGTLCLQYNSRLSLLIHLLEGLTSASRRQLQQAPREITSDSFDTNMILNDNFDGDWSDIEGGIEMRSNGLCDLPPGEEALYESSAGGESTLLAEAEHLVRGYVILKLHMLLLLTYYLRRRDTRKQNDRVQRLVDAWLPHLPALEKALLAFLAHGPPEWDKDGKTIQIDTRCWTSKLILHHLTTSLTIL